MSTYKVHNNTRDWQCPYCYLIIKSRCALYEHYKVCNEKKKQLHDSKGRVIPSSRIPINNLYKCEFCGRYSSTKSGFTNHVKHCFQNPNRVPGAAHKQSAESKKKISEGRRRNLENGIGNHWICPHINRSYAEQYFYDCFMNAGLSFDNNVWIGHYCVDFLFNNYYFEVDGEQHYTDDGIKHDTERSAFLNGMGYILLSRCRWSWFKSLLECDKVKYINDLISKIKQLIQIE